MRTTLMMVTATLAVLMVMACEQSPGTPAEHTHPEDPSRPDVTTHEIAVRASDFSISSGLATAGYRVEGLSKEIAERGEVHAYIKLANSSFWDSLPVVRTISTGSTYSIGAVFSERFLALHVNGPLMSRGIVSVFMPATVRLVMDAGTAS